MNKKIFKVSLFGVMTLAFMTSFIGCKDYDDDIDSLKDKVAAVEKSVSDIEAAMKANKYVVGYTAVANGYELTLSDGSKLTIKNGSDGKDGIDGKTIIPKFRVSTDNYWQISTDNGVTWTYVLSADGSSKITATGQKGDKGDSGTDASANVTVNDKGFIVIGDIITSLKATENYSTSTIAFINEVDGLYVFNINGKEYKLLAEGSAYNGLQSVTYRKQSADDLADFVTAYSLYNAADEFLDYSYPSASFKVWPKTLDIKNSDRVKFDFTDTYKTRSLEPVLSYVQNSAKWLDDKEGILSVRMKPANMDLSIYYASSLDITINGHTTASDYFNFKTARLNANDLDLFRIKPIQGSQALLATETFVYDKSYNLKDSVNLGLQMTSTGHVYESMAALGFDGVTASFDQTSGKAKGIFQITDGVITVKDADKSSAIGETCFVTATYKTSSGKIIGSRDFEVMAVREASQNPALNDIALGAKEPTDLSGLVYSSSEQRIALDVRSFLDNLGGRDYMCDNTNTTPIVYPLYYLTTVSGKIYPKKAVGFSLIFTPGVTTDQDKLELVVAGGTVLNGTHTLYSYKTWPGDSYEITSVEKYDWRKSATTYKGKSFAVNIVGIKCERVVTIEQYGAYVVNGKTTVVGKWTNSSFSMSADLADLYKISPSTESITYSLAPSNIQSSAVQAVYGQISVSGNQIMVSPSVNTSILGVIKIKAAIAGAGTDGQVTIKDINGGNLDYCELVLRSPLQSITYTVPDTWTIDDSNSTLNLGTAAKVSLKDRSTLPDPDYNVVIDKGTINAIWGPAYGISGVTYTIEGYSKTVSAGTFSVTSTGLQYNGSGLALDVDIYVKATVNNNWGGISSETITVHAVHP